MLNLRRFVAPILLGVLFIGRLNDVRAADREYLDSETRERCQALLWQTLRGDEFWPAMHAAEGLTEAGFGTEVIRVLLPKVAGETDDPRRCGLARELARAGRTEALATLTVTLSNPSSTGRIHAAESLFKLNEIGDREALRQAAQAPDIRLQQMAAAALARSGDAAALQSIRSGLNHHEMSVRRRAAWILAVVGEKSDIAPLKQKLTSATDPGEKAQYEHTLAVLQDDAAVESLLLNLTHPDASIRSNAAYFAGQAKRLEARPQLQALLSDDTPGVTVRAAHSLLTLHQIAQQSATADRRLETHPDPIRAMAAKLQPTRRVIYKSTAKRNLHLHIFEPHGWKATDQRPCFLVIHGGGWTSGNPRRLYPLADHFAKLGMVGISLEYRLLSPQDGVTGFDCVRDARSAVRYLRDHAPELGIDPNKLIVSGASAGGHLAVGTALFEQVNEEGDPTDTSSVPNALVLLYPVIDTSAQGYGQAKLGNRWKELSPLHQVQGNVPPTILFHGTADTVTPYAGAVAFQSAMQRAGNRCELISGHEGKHGYLIFDLPAYYQTLTRIKIFLSSLDPTYLPR